MSKTYIVRLSKITKFVAEVEVEVATSLHNNLQKLGVWE